MSNCENCNSHNLNFILEDNNCRIYKCPDCSLVKVYPNPSKSELHRIYSGIDRNIAKGAVLGEIKSFIKNSSQMIFTLKDMRINTLIKFFPDFKLESSICDVGCGSGVYLAALKSLGYRNLYGIEFNRDSVDLINENFNFKKVVQGEIKVNSEIPKVDLITAFDVIEHVPNPKESLLEINKMLNAKGYLHVRVPNYGSFWAKVFGRKWLWMIPPYHLNYFNLESLRRMVESSGFSIIKIRSRRSGYRIAFWYLQLKKLISGNIDSFGNTSYSKILYVLIFSLEIIFRIIYIPLYIFIYIFNCDDCIELYAQKADN